MEKLKQSAKKKHNLNINAFHQSAEELKKLFQKQLTLDNLKATLFRSSYFQHDDGTRVYVIQYILNFGKEDYPKYYLSFYGNDESDLLIPFLGMKGDNRAITIFHNEEINNIPKVMYELIEAEQRPCMYDIEFDFELEKTTIPV